MKDIKLYIHTWRFVFHLSKTYHIPYDPQLVSWFSKWTAKEVKGVKDHEFHMLFRPNLQIYIRNHVCMWIQFIDWRNYWSNLSTLFWNNMASSLNVETRSDQRHIHTMSILGSVPNIQSKLNSSLLNISYRKMKTDIANLYMIAFCWPL